MNIQISEIDGLYYVYDYDDQRHQCLSVGRSNPREGGRWFANGHSEKAIRYVGRAYTSKKSAQAYARKMRLMVAD